SKGMKQRINIAAALLSDPEVIMLDEPTTGLDPRGQSEVRDIVKDLKKKNRLVFMSSHLLNEVQEICDEVAMIDHGKLIVYDTLSNVTTRFSSGGSNTVEIELSRDIDEQSANMNIVSQIGVITKYELVNYFRSRRFFVLLIIGIIISALLTALVGYYRPSSFLSSALSFYSSWWAGPMGSITFVIVLSGIFYGGDAI